MSGRPCAESPGLPHDNGSVSFEPVEYPAAGLTWFHLRIPQQPVLLHVCGDLGYGSRLLQGLNGFQHCRGMRSVKLLGLIPFAI